MPRSHHKEKRNRRRRSREAADAAASSKLSAELRARRAANAAVAARSDEMAEALFGVGLTALPELLIKSHILSLVDLKLHSADEVEEAIRATVRVS